MDNLKKKQFDDILLENRSEFVLPVYKEFGIKPIVHLHIKYRLQDTIPEIALDSIKYAKLYIAVSDCVKKSILKIYPEGNVTFVHNGIRLENFNQITKSQARKQFKLSENDFILMYIGRVIDIKGVRELILSMHLLKDIPNLKLFIVGNASFGEGQTSPFMEELIEQSKELEDRIIFTDYISYDKIPNLLSAADVAIVPTIGVDAFALSCIEALASGTPLITTNSGGIPESCTGCASILEANKETLPEDLAKNIRELYEHPETCKRMSKLGLERSKQFSHERYAQKILDALM